MNDKLLMTFAIVAAVVSVIGAGMTYVSLGSYEEILLTGLVTDTARLNLSVTSNAAINFTTRNISFGTGYVNAGSLAGKLDTTATANENVTGFDQVSNGFVLENIGNVNVSLNLSFGKDAASFLGGTSPSYRFNVTNVEASSCTVATEYGTLGSWATASTTMVDVCNVFMRDSGSDTVRIDIELILPYNSNKNELSDILTATAVEI